MASAVATSAMPTVESCLSNPLGVVQESFASSGVGGGPESRWEQEVEHGMRALFSTAEAVSRIPSLNDTPVDQLRPGSLVRFRCMVQDVQDPEYYMGTFQQTNVLTGERSVATAKYRDAIPPQSEPMQDVRPQERLPLYCVPVPGETAWAAAAHTSSTALAGTTPAAEQLSTRSKRSMDSEDESEPVVQPSPPRHRIDMKEASGPVAAGMVAQATPKGASMQANVFPRREAANRPIAGSGGVPCLVKVYDEAGTSIRVHETFEFVGVLSVAPELAFAGACAPCNGGDGDTWVDGIEHTVPYSELPRLHAVFYRKIDPNIEHLKHQQLLPLPPAADTGGAFPLEHALGLVAPQIPVLRETFISLASAALGGDRLTAEYLLLHCISRIYARVADLCLGQFCLNITGVAAAAPPLHSPARMISQLLTSLLPTVHTFPLSVARLNDTAMIPKKDYDQNRLVAGMLQLASGTQLLVDETHMDEGQLTERGVANLKAMGRLLETGKLDFDFAYTPGGVSIDLDVSILSISTTRSLLPHSCTIPHVPQATSVDISSALLPETGEPALSGMRAYLAVMREASSRSRNSDTARGQGAATGQCCFEISKEAEEHAQRDFVACRRNDRNLKAEDLHRWLTMARLFALSHGDTELTPAHWEAMKGMEAARKMRMPEETATTAPSGAAAQSLSQQLANLQDSLSEGPEDDGSAARIAASIAARAEEQERAASN